MTSSLALIWLCIGLSPRDLQAAEQTRPAVQIAQESSDSSNGYSFYGRYDDSDDKGKRGKFGGLRRREKPPDYLLPKKDEEPGPHTQDLSKSSPQVLVPPDTAARLTELKALYDKGLISDAEYEASQTRLLADITATDSGVETGLRILRELWDQQLITASPYAEKRREILDAL